MLNTPCTYRLGRFLALPLCIIPAISAHGQMYLGGSLAASFAHLGHRSPQISYFSGTIITDDYPLRSNNQESTVYGAAAGYEFEGNGAMKPAIALGLGVYGNLGDYQFKGQVIETANGDPASTLYSYRFNAVSTRLMGEIQLNWKLSQFMPFLNFGLGSAWNSFTSYHEGKGNGMGYPPLLPFRSHMNHNVAYQAGCGISSTIQLSQNKSSMGQDRIAVGYRYVNLGQTTFGTRGSAYPFKLNTGLLETNEVFVAYTHLF